MNRNTLFLISSITLGILLLLLISSRYTNNKIETAEKDRREIYVLQEIIDSTNNEHPVINKALEGKVIVLNVWATWCKPCRKEIPELNKLVNDFKRDNILFIAIDDRDSTKEVKIMKEKNIQFDYQLLFDQEDLIDLIYSFKLEHEIRALPLNMVINKNGKIEVFYIGYKPEKLQEIRDYLASITSNEN